MTYRCCSNCHCVVVIVAPSTTERATVASDAQMRTRRSALAATTFEITTTVTIFTPRARSRRRYSLALLSPSFSLLRPPPFGALFPRSPRPLFIVIGKNHRRQRTHARRTHARTHERTHARTHPPPTHTPRAVRRLTIFLSYRPLHLRARGGCYGDMRTPSHHVERSIVYVFRVSPKRICTSTVCRI